MRTKQSHKPGKQYSSGSFNRVTYPALKIVPLRNKGVGIYYVLL